VEISMFKVQIFSVRDSVPRGPLTEDDEARTDTFATLAVVKRRVPVLLHGQSAFWQVRVFDAATGKLVLLGFRAGPGGTGERWAWREPDLRDRITEQDEDAHFRGDDDI
jgi:hypothetical protein